MKTFSMKGFHRAFALGFLAATILLACHLTNEAKTEQTFSLPNAAGILQGSDTALIVLKTPSGEIIDTLYHDKVAGASFNDLLAKNYKGGKAIVVIEGYKSGTLIVKVEKHYSGTSGQVDSTSVITVGPVPGAKVDSVVIAALGAALRAAGAVIQLRATVYPETSSQSVVWRSLDAGIAEITLQGSLSGKDSGTARIVATSVAAPLVSDTLSFQVLAPAPVASVAFDRAVLELYAEGASENLKVTVLPDGANPAVILTVGNALIVAVQDGKAKGLKTGETQITAVSLEDTTKTATLKVVVHPKPLAPVDSVSVTPDTLHLFTGSESKNLLATIYPRTHELRFSWHSAVSEIALVDEAGKVSPVSAGRTYVRANSLVDSARADSTLVIVMKDVPRILVGRDTTVSIGATVLYTPSVEQEHGTLVEAKWDLDDSAGWDETAASFRPVSRTYFAARDYNARFYAKDSEGNDTIVVKKVKVVNGPVILFRSPLEGSYTNVNPISITWSVDGVEQTANETLKPGPNSITRTAKNAVGETFSATIIVHYDVDPPTRPIVKGPSGPIRSLRPAWAWERAGGGNGTFRWRLDIDNLTTGTTQTTDTALTPGFDLTQGAHTLFVQERDAAGNWSPSGSFQVRIDTLPPAAPTVSAVTPTPTRNQRPTWTWAGTTSEGTSSYRYKLDDNDFRSGAMATSALQFTPEAAMSLTEGLHILYVQHADSAGNWSPSGSATIRVDLTPPAAPRVTIPTSPTNDRTPTFTFTPQGGGGNGTYRVKFNDRNLGTGAIEVSTAGYSPADSLAPGKWVLHVQERDTAGNWSASDSGIVTIDLTVPSSPVVNAPDGTPTRDQTPRWSWKQSAGGTGVFRFRFNNPNLEGHPETTDTQYVHGTDLPENSYTLYVQQKNAAGTWSGNGSKVIRVDLTKPATPVVTPLQISPITERRPTWNWNHTETGTGLYQYSLNGAPFRDTNSTSFRAWADLGHGTHVLRIMERDSAGNLSDAGSASVSIDIQGPNPPTINPASPQSPVGTLRPTFSWSSGGNGGSGQFRFKIDNSAYSTWGTTMIHQTPTLSEGTHTLSVQERDALGNESGEVSRSIVLVQPGYLGPSGISSGQAYRPSAAYSQRGLLHVAHTTNSASSILQYNNGWSTLGGVPYSQATSSRNEIAFSSDTAFVAYLEPVDDGQRLIVKKYRDGAWSIIGGGKVDSGSFFYAIDLAVSADGTPYVAWMSPDNYDIRVSRLNRSQNRWEAAGNQDIGGSNDDGGCVSLAINASNEVHVAYTDYRSLGAFGSPTVKKLAGNSWSEMRKYIEYTQAVHISFGGNTPFLTYAANNFTKFFSFDAAWNPAAEYQFENLQNPTVAVTPSGTPFVAGIGAEAANNVIVLTPVNGSLVALTASMGRTNTGHDISIAVSPTGVPHVAFIDYSTTELLSVEKFGFKP